MDIYDIMIRYHVYAQTPAMHSKSKKNHILKTVCRMLMHVFAIFYEICVNIGTCLNIHVNLCKHVEKAYAFHDPC